jgi:Spinocerebellar ataxia type 10 protein domain
MLASHSSYDSLLPAELLHYLTQHPDHPTVEAKRHIVRFMANVSYRNPAVQDRLGENGGLLAVLNNCLIQDANPCMFAVYACVFCL